MNFFELLKELEEHHSFFEYELDDNSQTIWFTTIKGLDLYINYDCYSNNEPLFMTNNEMNDAIGRKIKIKGLDHVDEMFDVDREEIICKLNEKGIAFEYAYMKLKERIQEEFRSFFEHGQYVKYPELNAASRPCVDNKDLDNWIKKPSMGAVDTGYYNLGIVLNIPKQCFDEENPWPLYQYIDGMVLGTYRNVEEVRRAIPREYIKEGVYKCGNTIIKFPNPYFNKDYRLPYSDDPYLYNGMFNAYTRNKQTK